MATYIERMLEEGVADLFEEWGWADTISNEVYNLVTWMDANPRSADIVMNIIDATVKGTQMQVVYNDFKWFFDEYDREAAPLDMEPKATDPESIPRSLPRTPTKRKPDPVSDDFLTPAKKSRNTGSDSNQKAEEIEEMHPSGAYPGPYRIIRKPYETAGVDMSHSGLKSQKVRIKKRVLRMAGEAPQVSPPTPYQEFTSYEDQRINSADNRCAYFTYVHNDRTHLDSLMGKFREIIDVVDDENQPTGSDPFDFSIYQNTVLETKSWMKLFMRNNYNYKVRCEVYVLKPRDDLETDISPDVARKEGLNLVQGFSRTSTVPNLDEPHMRPEDSPTFIKKYFILKKYSVHMNPGQENEIFYKFPKILYSDSHQSLDGEYLKHATRFFYIRILGSLGHAASSNDLVGFTASYLDTICQFHDSFRAYGANPFLSLQSSDIADIEESAANIQNQYTNIEKETAFNT